MSRLSSSVNAAEHHAIRTTRCTSSLCQQLHITQAARQRRVHVTPFSNASRVLSSTCFTPLARPITSQPKILDKSTGYVYNEADLDQIPSEWNSLLNSVVAAYEQVCGPRLVGVYLRGSLPRGCFIEGISDVDTFALVLDVVATRDSLPDTGNANGSSAAGALVASGTAADQDYQQQQLLEKLSNSLAESNAGLGFTKMEAKILAVSADSPALAVLQQHMSAQTLSTSADAASSPCSTSPEPSSSSSSNGTYNNSSNSNSSRKLPSITPSMLLSLPAAFELKTQSVRLTGVDLPSLLPAAAALPPAVQLLPGLTEDIAAARDEAAAADLRGDVQRQVVVAKWSLKRLLRCAFELVQPQAAVWTRDLFWCCHYAGQHLPQIKHKLQEALELYVLLQQQQQQLRSGKLQQQKKEVQQQLSAAWAVIDTLLPRIETMFLKLMLAEEPGWLTHHQAQPIPATVASAVTATSDNIITAAAQARITKWQQWLRQPWSNGSARQTTANGQSMQTTSVTHAAAAGGGGSTRLQAPPKQLLGSSPPVVAIPVWGSVAAADWNLADEQIAAYSHISTVLMRNNSSRQPNRKLWYTSKVAASSQPQQQQQRHQEDYSELSDCHPQPLLLQGLASDWPAVSGVEPWGLNWLSRQEFSGRVRAAPSLQFSFVEPQLLELLQQIAGPAAAPSCQFTMSCSEFMTRLQPGCQLPRLLYEPHEYYYMQADLSEELQQQLRLPEFLRGIEAAGAQSEIACTDLQASSKPASNRSRGHSTTHQMAKQDNHSCYAESKQDTSCDDGRRTAVAPTPTLQFSQAPRIWISPAGAVSPLHYDTSHSFLVQISGYKRMLFFSPDQLYRLYCYPDTHLLRRRSRVNVSAPDFERFPLFKGAGALEVVLGPGDCVFFPSMWAHYTESLGENSVGGVVSGCSVSVTFRLQAA